MQIHEYPSIPQAPADADVLAIEVNGITYKVSKAVLAAAIIDKLGGDPVTVDHGGTGASTAENARTNLSVYSKSETDSAIQQSTATKATRRIKSVTLGAGNTASVSDIINSGEVGILFVQQNSFTVQNLGYMALVRRSGAGYYVTSPSWPTSETLRPTLGTDGVLSVTNAQYSGTYVCMFMPFA